MPGVTECEWEWDPGRRNYFDRNMEMAAMTARIAIMYSAKRRERLDSSR